MNHLSVHLTNYLKLRRGLGFKLHSAGMLLRNFVRFAETKRARFITTKLALQWATQWPNIKRVQRGSRLGVVRRFAEYVSTVDPRTEVPPPKLLPYCIRRRPPHLYCNDDVRRLVGAAYQIDPANPIKGPTLGTLLGLLAGTILPTSGDIRRPARVGTLIALGAGFDQGRDGAWFGLLLCGGQLFQANQHRAFVHP